MDATVVDYLVVAGLGVLVGIGELVTRYRDAPGRALTTLPAILYLALNAGASLAALALVRVFDWKFGAGGGDSLRWTQVLAGGFGAMALFRTSLFIVKVGGEDLGIGPSGFLQAMLAAADRGVDRRRASARAKGIKIMETVSFEKAHASLPAFCLALMQDVSAEDQQKLGDQVALLVNDDMSDETKSRVLGLLLMNVVGEKVLSDAIDSLGSEIQREPPQPSG